MFFFLILSMENKSFKRKTKIEITLMKENVRFIVIYAYIYVILKRFLDV